MNWKHPCCNYKWFPLDNSSRVKRNDSTNLVLDYIEKNVCKLPLLHPSLSMGFCIFRMGDFDIDLCLHIKCVLSQKTALDKEYR